eukprot:758974-Hanusia_phi.AAC.4
MTTLASLNARRLNVLLATTSILLAFVTNSPRDAFRPYDASASLRLKAQRYSNLILLSSTRLRGGMNPHCDSASHILEDTAPSWMERKEAISLHSDPALASPIQRAAGSSLLRAAAPRPSETSGFKQHPSSPVILWGTLMAYETREITVTQDMVPGTRTNVSFQDYVLSIKIPETAFVGQHLKVQIPLPKANANSNPFIQRTPRVVYTVLRQDSYRGSSMLIRNGDDQVMVRLPYNLVAGQRLEIRYDTFGKGRGAPLDLNTFKPRQAQYVKPPVLPPNPGSLNKRLILTYKDRDRAMQIAAEYNTSLYYINTEVLENIPKFELSRKVRNKGVSPSDPMVLMGANFLAQIPSKCVVMLDFLNHTLANRVSKALQNYGRFSTRSSENWMCCDTLDVLINTTRYNDRGKSYDWKLQGGKWTWVDPDTLLPVSSVLQEVNRTVSCFLPRPTALHRWMKAPLCRWFLWPVAGKPPSAFHLFRMFLRHELLHNIATRKEEEVSMEQRLNFFMKICSNVTFGKQFLDKAKAYSAMEKSNVGLLLSMRWMENVSFPVEFGKEGSGDDSEVSCISDRSEAWKHLEMQLDSNFSSIQNLSPGEFISFLQQVLREQHGIKTTTELKKVLLDRNALERQIRNDWKMLDEQVRASYQGMSQRLQDDYAVYFAEEGERERERSKASDLFHGSQVGASAFPPTLNPLTVIAAT